ncbi:protein SSX1-like [Sus scrofa]|uniref:Protein SSX1-like n=2 Tax=Sus scrofa TaxID=9823 RepID=A0A8D1D3R6_PIG|nr:protein SSX1-like [Sus scrofa]
MNRGSYFAQRAREDAQKSEKKSKAFNDISKYFSKEEWAKLGYSEKITYVYMKRNYDTMTGLGLKATPPTFMCPRKQTIESSGHDSEDQDEPPKEASNLRGRKYLEVMPKTPEKEKNLLELGPTTSGSEKAPSEPCLLGKASASAQQSKETSGSGRSKINVWTHRLRERKYPVIYEEISDPEEDD